MSEPTILPPPNEPMPVARHVLAEAYGGQLRQWRGTYYAYRGTHWAEISDESVRADIYRLTEHAVYFDDGKQYPWKPNRHKVADVTAALAAVAHLSEQIEPPAWIGSAGPGPVIALRNGLLRLSDRTLHDHTPDYFNLVTLPYDYDPGAPPPRRWLTFLEQLWKADAESVALLQEFYGYVLSGETGQQKMLMIIGPPRSGKGTIAFILQELLGPTNHAGPTLASLGNTFGLWTLLGKVLAVVSDARLTGASPLVVERLLAISGEDAITVERKYKTPWTGRLGVRFIVISNELPKLGDASAAIATRFLVLDLTESWLGREDTTLRQTLAKELPSILNWALDGLDRLHQRGVFIEPRVSRDAVTSLMDLASPVGAFVREQCKREPDAEIPTHELYATYRSWCINNGHRARSQQVFGRDLRAACPGLSTDSRRHGADRWRAFVGIRLSHPQEEGDYLTRDDTRSTALYIPLNTGDQQPQLQPQLPRYEDQNQLPGYEDQGSSDPKQTLQCSDLRVAACQEINKWHWIGADDDNDEHDEEHD